MPEQETWKSQAMKAGAEIDRLRIEMKAKDSEIKAYAEARVNSITIIPIQWKLIHGLLGHRAKCPLTQREYMFHEGVVSIRVRISMEEIGKAQTLEEASVIIEADRNQFLRGHLK